MFSVIVILFHQVGVKKMPPTPCGAWQEPRRRVQMQQPYQRSHRIAHQFSPKRDRSRAHVEHGSAEAMDVWAGMRMLPAHIFRFGDTVAAATTAALALAMTTQEPIKRSVLSTTGKKAGRREIAMKGCKIASSGIGNSVRIWWDEKKIRFLQQGEAGKKTPKHGGWNDKILHYLDQPGFIMSMRCGIGLQDVWIVKFKDGFEIPLHKDCIYKSMYPQLRSYLRGINQGKKPKGLGTHLQTLPVNLRLIVSQFLFHGAKPGKKDHLQSCFLKVAKISTITKVIKKSGVKTPKFEIEKPTKQEGVEVLKTDFERSLTNTPLSPEVVSSVMKSLEGVIGRSVSWQDIIKLCGGGVGGGIRSNVSKDKPESNTTAGSSSTASKRTSSIPTLAERRASAAAARDKKSSEDVVVVAGKPPSSSTTTTSTTEVKKDDPVQSKSTTVVSSTATKKQPDEKIKPEPASPSKLKATKLSEDIVIRRGERSLPLEALQEECHRLTMHVEHLQNTVKHEEQQRLSLQDTVNCLRWQNHYSAGSSKATRKRSTIPNNSYPISITLNCVVSKLSRMSIPNIKITASSTDSLFKLSHQIEDVTGIPAGRQVLGVLHNNRMRRLQDSNVTSETLLSNTLLGKNKNNGDNTVIVSESGPVTLKIHCGPNSVFTLRAYPDERLDSVKEMCVEKSNQNLNLMTLYLNNEPLSVGSKSLWEYGIRSGTVLLDLRRSHKNNEKEIKIKIEDEGAPRTLNMIVKKNESVGHVKERISSRLHLKSVDLLPSNGLDCIPDTVIMRSIPVSSFVASRNETKDSALRLSHHIHAVHTAIESLTSNTSKLQTTVNNMKGGGQDSFATPTTAMSPSLIMASTRDSASHVINSLTQLEPVLDVVRKS